MDRQPMTREQFEKLRDDIRLLEEEEMPKVVQAIAAARAEGDLSENAEYHGQRERQGLLQAEINKKKATLSNSYIVDPSQLEKGVVNFGSVVTVRDLDEEFDEAYELVGPGQEDYTADPIKILTTSPIAQGLIGKKAGEQVEVEVPNGTVRMEILEIQDPS